MELFLFYILKSSICLIALYIPFRIFIRKETFFRTNRFGLLAITFLSLVLPLLNLSGIIQEHYIYFPEMIIMAQKKDLVTTNDTIHWHWPCAICYLSGVIFFLIRKVNEYVKLKRTILQGRLWIHDENGIRIHCHINPTVPFSWMSHIVISEKDYLENGKQILLHETAHIRCRHSWDTIWLSFMEILQWFNPFVWMLSKDMNAIHEFEADRMVLCKGIDKVRYQLLMIRKVTNRPEYTFSNYLNQGQVKQRILMMNTSISPKRWKYLYLLPLIVACIIVYTQKQPAYIQGRVTDEYGNALPDVMVDVPHVHVATLTFTDGMYSIDAGKEDTIRFRMRGYDTQNISLKDYPIYNGTIILNVQLSKK